MRYKNEQVGLTLPAEHVTRRVEAGILEWTRLLGQNPLSRRSAPPARDHARVIVQI